MNRSPNRRVLDWFGVLILIMMLGALLPAAAQTSVLSKPAPAENRDTWTLQRTPDGQPDLQGVWTNASSIPMERPKNLGAKEFYTPQEAAELGKGGYRGDRAPLPEAHYDMSQFGIDPMQAKFAPNLRTSLIIGPDGRIPPMLPEA